MAADGEITRSFLAKEAEQIPSGLLEVDDSENARATRGLDSLVTRRMIVSGMLVHGLGAFGQRACDRADR